MKINLKKPEYIIVNEENIVAVCEIIEKEINKYSIIKNGRDLINVCPLAYDTETSTVDVPDSDNKYSFIYLNQLGVGRYNFIIRDYTLVIEIMKFIALTFSHCVCILGIANLKFEMSFIMRELLESVGDSIKTKVLIPHSREPLVLNLGGLRIVDVCKIANSSLETIGKNFTSTKKLVGGLNYDIIRNKKTPIKKFEMLYALNDIVVVKEYITYLHDNFTTNNKKFPLTSTSIPRNEMKKAAKDEPQTVAIVKDSFPETYADYINTMTYLFRGGYVHANDFYVGEKVNNVGCADYTSDYPAVMLQEEYPTLFKNEIIINGKSIASETLANEKGLKFLISNNLAFKCVCEFDNLNATTTHSVESLNKAINERELIHNKNCFIDNGRIRKAKKLVVALTELDFDIYSKFYKWDKVTVSELEIAVKTKLPNYVLTPLLNQYKGKADLKNKGLDKTPEYAMKKGVLNSCYGVMVQRINMESYIPLVINDEFKQIKVAFNRELFIEPKTKTAQMKYIKRCYNIAVATLKKLGLPTTEKNVNMIKIMIDELVWGCDVPVNKIGVQRVLLGELQEYSYRMEIKNNLFLSPYWGIWVTAYARNRILNMIYDIEMTALNEGLDPQILYSDTDSIYFINPDKWLYKIDEYNAQTKNKNISLGLAELYQDLGLFDYNPKKDLYTAFKTLGAKRYIKTNCKGETIATVSGLKKSAFTKVTSDKDPYTFFNTGMIVDEFTTDKLCSIYTDTPYSLDVVDYLGNVDTMTQKQGVELRPVSFELTVIGALLDKILKTERYK